MNRNLMQWVAALAAAAILAGCGGSASTTALKVRTFAAFTLLLDPPQPARMAAAASAATHCIRFLFMGSWRASSGRG
jgi:hypothetical protein